MVTKATNKQSDTRRIRTLERYVRSAIRQEQAEPSTAQELAPWIAGALFAISFVCLYGAWVSSNNGDLRWLLTDSMFAIWFMLAALVVMVGGRR